MATLLLSLAAAPATAQDAEPAPAPPDAADEAAPDAEASPDVDVDASEPASDAEPPTAPSIEEATDGADEDATSEQARDDDEPPEWLRGFSITAFADGYAQAVWTQADPFSNDHGDAMSHRAFDNVAGLTLAWLGLDVSYNFESVGARLDLRFGTAVPRLLGPTSGLPDGMQFLKQAYVFWRPTTNVQIDFGQFDTIYGAEVSESWRNHTYSRGALYNVAQPFYHTGFRASWEPVDGLTVTAVAVNGWNNVLDNNDGKTFGAQLSWENDDVRISGGYLAGPEGDRDDLWRHFADVVVAWTIGDLELLANANYVAEDTGAGSFDQLLGGMLSGRLRFPPHFALALRGEVLADLATDTQLATGTFTIETTPIRHLVIRLDNRVDVATDDRFQDPSGQPTQTVFSTILGMVVHSD